MFNGYFWGGGRVRIPDYVIPGNLAKEAAYHELEVMWTIQLYIWMCLAAVIISRNKRTWWKTILKSNPWTLHVCAYSYHIILTLTYLSRPLEHFLRQIGWGEKKKSKFQTLWIRPWHHMKNADVALQSFHGWLYEKK